MQGDKVKVCKLYGGPHPFVFVMKKEEVKKDQLANIGKRQEWEFCLYFQFMTKVGQKSLWSLF